ncbi:unnamed protein product [Rotaria socialis]|uniref:TIR domain-containing protein n=2 Tax=Rotaria socialis TaxID=392032 RepID=A0A821BKJ4_9BILA|nr:unnamed protein product [Rotaria socialis]
MVTLPISDSIMDYSFENDIQKRFFKIPQFRLCLQEYLFKRLSFQTEISLYSSRKKSWHDTEQTMYRIQLVGKYENKPDTKEVLHNTTKKFLQNIHSKVYNHNTIGLKWFISYTMSKEKMKFLHELVNKKINDIITIFELDRDKLHMHYFPKQTSNTTDTDPLMNFIENEILQEIIPLPLPHERSLQLDNELKQITSQEMKNDEILITRNGISRHANQKDIVLFGYDRKVIEIQKQILTVIEKYILITYKLNSIGQFQINTLDEAHWSALEDIETQHKDCGVDIRLTLNEFSAPRHLKDEIESSIEKLLSQPATTIEFSSIPLLTDIAEKEEQHVRAIAQRCYCSVKTELLCNYQSYPLPKASISNKQISKAILEQSELFCSSPDVYKKRIIADGSIELRTGDIALQKVDTIIISTTFNGLREGVIDRLGEIDYEKTHSDVDGTMYTETNGGKLNCKRVLFTNWLPNSLINNDNALRLSIKIFISKSFEYTIQDNDTLSIAFAVPDSCNNENILADEMIHEAKRQLKTRKLPLKVSFVCLPEQKTLYEQFSNIFQTKNDVGIYVDWLNTIIKVTLIGYTIEDAQKCEKTISSYLSRCISSVKITKSNDIFQSWDQHAINSFYKYCKDRCILPKIAETKNEIELMGPPTSILEIKKKLLILSELMAEKLRATTTMGRPSSAMSHSTARSENITNVRMGRLYNVVVSYSRNDLRKCQRLINRLTEEGFSIGTHSKVADEQHDLCSEMDKSDCIILCISGNYYENPSCIAEAKYAFQTDKKVFLVKIQNNPILGWNSDPFDGKLFFNSFGSDLYFDLEYGRLLIELLRFTKPGFTSVLQRRSSRAQIDPSILQQSLSIENSSKTKHREATNSSIKSLSTIISNTKEERKSNDHLKNIVPKRELSFLEECWLRKLIDNQKPNLTLFGFDRREYNNDGDDGDNKRNSAELLANSYKISDNYVNSILYTSPFCGHSSKPSPFSVGRGWSSVHDTPMLEWHVNKMPIDEDQTYGKPTEKLEVLNGLSQVFPTTEHSIDDFIPRRRPSRYFYSISYNGGDGDYRDAKQMKERLELENPEKMQHIRVKLADYFMNTYKKYTREELDFYLTFAQRMKDNTVKFEAFCLTITATTNK